MYEGFRWVVAAERQLVREPLTWAEPGPGQLLLRTEASLVSAGTELAIYTGIHQGLANPNARWPKFPQPMGYMAVARVVATGPDVSNYRAGDRLLTSTGHATYATVEVGSGRFWPLPEGIPAEQAVFARMARTAFAAIAQAEVTAAQSVAIVGLGIIGQIALRLFRAAGAHPIAGVDPVAMRREAAARGGASLLFPSAEEAAAALRTAWDGGADVVVDATGWATALPGALALARDAGRVIVLGSPRGTAAEVDFYTDLHRRSLRVIGAHDSGIGVHVRDGFPWTTERVVPACIAYLTDGRLPVADLITHALPAERLPELYQGLLEEKERYLGCVLLWQS